MIQTKIITESQFYMWRSLFALSHADDVVTDEEMRMMFEILEDLPFSLEQTKLLEDDIRHPKDPVEMFTLISNSRDQAAFFQFARKMVWVDGDFGDEEKELMIKLQKIHMANVDINDLIGNTKLSLEQEHYPFTPKDPSKETSLSELIKIFKMYFLSDSP